ncbi:MAG: hypothetical protein LBR56_04185 [Sporomusaceae bacterium]|jgi:beta-1,4-mannosyl-glycoprotein beta-1,4-N-acetylglucosaminyltransferase|nr:hypothetical protein [Sporomusaceae bacterium]
MKVYDCFTFYNEFELLELRLNLLQDSVDYFVLVEANRTHKNDAKELLFERGKKFFSKYLAKIIHIKVEDMPSYDANDPNDGWKLENYQRNCITRGLNNLDPDDLVIISDADEIPNPQIIDFFKNHAQLLDNNTLALRQQLFYYFVNLKCTDFWYGSVITKFKNLTSPQELRNKREIFSWFKDGGWHFSYMGGVENILMKLNATVEAKRASSNKETMAYINHCMSNGLDIYNRADVQLEFIDIDNLFPPAVEAAIQKYPYLYFKTSENG